MTETALENKQIIAFEGKAIKVTKEEYDTFVASISTQEPTVEEIKLHLWYCDSKGVNPLDKLIYFTKRKGRYTPVTSIDYMRIRAESSEVYAGSDDAVFVDGASKYPVSATVTVWKMVQGKLGRFTATARWDEYAPSDLNQAASFMWKKMPRTMLAKCAEALALRKAFPGQLHGLYAREEMAQDGRYVEMDSDTDYSQSVDAEVHDQPQNAHNTTQTAPEQPVATEATVGTPELVAEANKAPAGEETYTGNQILGSKDGHLVKELVKMTGKATVDVCKVVGTFEKGKKFTLEQVKGMILAPKEA